MENKNINQNIEWFNSYINNIENNAIQKKEENISFNCPCCSYPTLDGRGIYDICSLCNWEDDGQDTLNADEIWGGPNGDYSLTEARNNFKNYLTQYRASEDRAYQSSKTIKTKKKIIELFDRLKNNLILSEQEKIKIQQNIDILFKNL